MKRKLAILALGALPLWAQTGSINGVPNQVMILPAPSTSTLGGVESNGNSPTTNQWVQYIDNSGVSHLAQVAFSNLNGSAACGQLPALTGDATTSAGNCATSVGAIGGHAVSLGGSFTMSGAYTFAGALTGATSITFPTSGTLATLGLNTFTRTQTMNVNTVAHTSSPAFDLSQGNVQYVSAVGENETPSFSNITAGGWWRFILCQNSTGGFTFTWPSSVHGGITIGTTASKCSVQDFSSPDGANLYAENTGVVNQ